MKKIKIMGLIILILIGGWIGLFLFIDTVFGISAQEERHGNQELMRIFTEIGLPPEKVTTTGRYAYAGGGLTFKVYFSEELINSRPILKENKELHKDYVEVYVLQVGYIDYFSLRDSLFNSGLAQYLENEAEKYYEEIGKPLTGKSMLLLQLDTKEQLEKSVIFYEEALSMVILTDNSAQNRIDTVTLKPDMDDEFRQLIIKMDEAGLFEMTTPIQ